MPRQSADPLVVVPVPAFQDNYLWLLQNGAQAVVVDPGDAAVVETTLADLGLRLSAIVLTHHHQDHTGGVLELCARRPMLPVFGPAQENIPGVTHPLVEGQTATLTALGLELRVLEVPGHTKGHIAYYCERSPAPLLFCGDTLFGCGCGRLFEGTAQQMQTSLAKLSALPDETLVYCAHEYTLSNIRFAQAVEPDNVALRERAAKDRGLRDQGRPTLPSTLAVEKQTNPFLRWDFAAVRAAAESQKSGAGSSPTTTFAAIRAWKDHF